MTRVFAGRPDHVREARHQVGKFLDGHPRRDDAVLIISEFASNAVLFFLLSSCVAITG